MKKPKILWNDRDGHPSGPKMMPPLRGFFLNPQRLIMAHRAT
jgi:hypothetical protein